MAQVGSINGVAVSPGLALGPVHVVRARTDAVPTWSVGPDEIEREVARLRGALDEARAEL